MKELGNAPAHWLARHHPRWKKNRDFADGEDAVKCAKTLYLPSIAADMSPADYSAFIERVAFFPAVSRTLDGWMGLAFRNDPVLVSSRLEPFKDGLTQNVDSLEELCEQLVREVMQTNWTGLMVDLPNATSVPGLNKANAVQRGQRPFVTLFPAETILDIEFALNAEFKRVPSYVKLHISHKEYRELWLRGGVYEIDTFQSSESGWVHVRTDRPLRNGEPLDFIPFQIISTKNARKPTKSMLEDSVNINNNHYKLEALHAQALFFTASPKAVVSGVKPVDPDADGKITERVYNHGSHIVWELGEGADAKYLEFSGAGVLSLREQLKEYKSQLAQVGARILADEKAVSEAPEALEIRRASENATLAGAVRTVSRHVEIVLRWMSWWLGAEDKQDPDTRLQINTDFVPSKVTAEELTAYTAAMQAGVLTEEELFYINRRGGLIDEAVTFDEHKAKVEITQIDKPVAL